MFWGSEMDINSDMKNMLEEAKKFLEDHNDSITLVTHIDADGLTSGGIVSQVLERLGKDYKVKTSKLSPEFFKNLEPDDLTIFTDLGSGQLDLLENFDRDDKVLVLDHHQPKDNDIPTFHINPHFFGYEGYKDVSGAGVSYLLAREFGFKDLCQYGIVGAVGDQQASWGELSGLNRIMVEDGLENGYIDVEKDLMLFGRDTRPLYKALQYFTDPWVPGISNNEEGAIALLSRLNIPLKDNGWRKPGDLTDEEKKKLGTALSFRSVKYAPEEFKPHITKLIVGESYILLNQQEKTPLRNAREFSTSLNAAGKNGAPKIGLEITKGNKKVYPELMSLLRSHRKKIARSLDKLGDDIQVTPNDVFQYFDATGKTSRNIVGTIAGMLLGTEDSDPYKPMIGFVSNNGETKISARGSKLLQLKGVNLANAIEKVADELGGEGGGHAPACGATIPSENLDKFMELYEEELNVA